MRRLVCLVTLAALAVPCAASDPAAPRMDKRKSPRPPRLAEVMPVGFKPVPPPLFSDRLLRAVLFPDRALAGWLAAQSRPRVVVVPPPPPAFGAGVVIRR